MSIAISWNAHGEVLAIRDSMSSGHSSGDHTRLSARSEADGFPEGAEEEAAFWSCFNQSLNDQHPPSAGQHSDGSVTPLVRHQCSICLTWP